MSSGKHRTYFVTLNNPSAEEISSWKQENFSYILIGDEHAPTTNTHHIHVYINFSNPISWSALKKRHTRSNILISEGTQDRAEKNKIYLSKENLLFEDGTPPTGQGSRSDIEVCRDIVKSTNSMREVVACATSLQGIRIAEYYLKYHEQPRSWKPHVTWISGASGTGKSHLARELLGSNIYTCMKTGKWFEGYDAHEDVLVDDIRKSFMKFSEFLQFIDKYEFRIECKGSSRQFLAKRIVITSIYPHDQLWSTREDLYQLTRRIDRVIKFEGPSFEHCVHEGRS